MSPLALYVRPDEHCASLTRDYFILQRRKGHRYSVDDLLVAHLAATSGTTPTRVLDLGCGIGSVLLMVGWAAPEAQLVGIEAQQESVALAYRNLELNGCAHRTTLIHGDLRDPLHFDRHGKFDVVTGTPPYFDPKAATPCSDPQRAAAKFELRGGIEQYARAASQALSADGRFVVCAPASPADRGIRAMQAAGLFVRRRRPVLPGPNRPAFLELIEAGARACELREEPPLVLRDSDGRRSAEHASIRSWFGVPASEW